MLSTRELARFSSYIMSIVCPAIRTIQIDPPPPLLLSLKETFNYSFIQWMCFFSPKNVRFSKVQFQKMCPTHSTIFMKFAYLFTTMNSRSQNWESHNFTSRLILDSNCLQNVYLVTKMFLLVDVNSFFMQYMNKCKVKFV